MIRRRSPALLVLGVLLLAAAPVRAAGWGPPAVLTPPVPVDLNPAEVALSGTGAAAIGYAVGDEDAPAGSTAWLIQRRAGRGFGPTRAVAGGQQTLAVDYGPSGLELLAGTSQSGQRCCSRVQAFGPIRGASFGHTQTVFGGLTGATLARLVSLRGRLLAVAATERGVWSAQSAPGAAHFGSAHRLSARKELPQSLDSVALGGGRSVVAWTARTGGVTAAGPRRIYISYGSLHRSPRRATLLLTVPSNHSVDELALASAGAQPTLAWIESWFDRRDRFRSRVEVADLGAPRLAPRPVSSARELASGLSFGNDARGDEALAWKGCDNSGGCAVRAVLRRARGRFGAVQRGSAIDASQQPAAAVTGSGTALVGWVQSGHVLVASTRTTRLGHRKIIARSDFAADLTLAAAPRSAGALAVWTEGTLNESVEASGFAG